MKKVCNFRPIAIFGLSLVAGGYLFAVGIFRQWAMILAIIAVSIMVLSAILFGFLKKSFKPIVVVVLSAILPFLLGGIMLTTNINHRLDSAVNSGVYQISGVVKQGGSKQNNGLIILTDVTLSQGQNGIIDKKIIGEVSVRLTQENGLPQVFVGDRLSFEGYFSSTYNKTCKDNPLAVDSFAGYANGNDGVEITRGSGIKYNILKWSRKQLNSVMASDEADVAYGMLYGDKILLDGDIKSAYKAAGISHILAVSGLHIGFMITILGFLLSKVLKNKWAYASIILVILGFYAYVCGFTPSVMRAVIMCGIVLLSKSIFEQYDGLNALSISAIINCILTPLNIFNIGFLLSFGVTFSIFSLSKPMGIRLSLLMPQKMASSLSLSIAAWVGSVPVVMFYFKTISTYSVLINFLLLPVISVLFVSLVAGLLLSIIPGTAAVFLALPMYFLRGLNLFIQGVASIKFSIISISASFLSMIIGMLAVAVISQYNLIKNKLLYGLVIFGVFISTALVYTLT